VDRGETMPEMPEFNSQLKRIVLSTLNFSEKDFPAAIGGSAETLSE
jgi:hypothetical protein